MGRSLIQRRKNIMSNDDTQFEGEKNVLIEKGALDKFILINLKANPNQLLDIVNGRVG